MGDLDTLSREFAREHSGRLWKQLVLSGEDEPARPSSGWFEALVFALAAAIVIQAARLAAQFPKRNQGGCCGTSLCSCCRSSPGTSPADGSSTRGDGC
jgi:hypothetical protein